MLNPWAEGYGGLYCKCYDEQDRFFNRYVIGRDVNQLQIVK